MNILNIRTLSDIYEQIGSSTVAEINTEQHSKMNYIAETHKRDKQHWIEIALWYRKHWLRDGEVELQELRAKIAESFPRRVGSILDCINAISVKHIQPHRIRAWINVVVWLWIITGETKLED